MNMGDLRDLLDDPAVEESRFIQSFFLVRYKTHFVVREDGSVLRDDVKEMDATQFNCLRDVMIGCNGQSETPQQKSLSNYPTSHPTSQQVTEPASKPVIHLVSQQARQLPNQQASQLST